MELKIQTTKKYIDGELQRFSRTEISDETEYCCDRMSIQGEMYLNDDNKFGFAKYEYKCGEDWFKETMEVHFCPFCGDKIDVVKLPDIIKKGLTKYEETRETVEHVIKKNKRIEWDDGTIDKRGDSYSIPCPKL